ncbi:MAG: hypothetical protein VKP72_13375 [bacterium]|nr:hypothetical protein [bacterium]
MSSRFSPRLPGAFPGWALRFWGTALVMLLAGCLSMLTPASTAVRVQAQSSAREAVVVGQPAGLQVNIRLPARGTQALPGSWSSILLTLTNADTTLLPSTLTTTRNQAGGTTVSAVFSRVKSGSGYALDAKLFDGSNATGNKVAKGFQNDITLQPGPNQVTLTLMAPVATDWRTFPDELYACGSVVFVNGHFEPPASVTFAPSGATAPMTVLSSYQATFTVPCSATTGTVTFTDPDGTSNALPIRIAEYGLGFARSFSRYYNQATIARSSPSLGSARASYGLVQRGDHLFVLGGTDGTSAYNTILSALKNADGTLLSFADTGLQLFTHRVGPAVVDHGGKLLVIGGSGFGGAMATTETSTWQVNGQPGSFTASRTMLATRAYASALVLGDYLYVFGGRASSVPRNTIERAPINSTGTLTGPFEAVSSTLVTARSQAGVFQQGGRVYLVGGRGPSGAVSSIESAPVLADGSIGAFTTGSVTLTTPRAGFALQMLGTRVAIIGGYTTGDTPLASVETATLGASGPGTFSIESGISLLTARYGISSALIGDQLHVFGGLGTGGTGLTSIEFAPANSTGQLDSFSSGSGTFTPRFGNGAAVLGSRVNVYGGCGGSITTGGGCSSDGSILSTIQQAVIDSSGAVGSFAASGSLDVGRVNFTSAVLGTNLWVFAGGIPSSAPNNTPKVIYAPIESDGSIGTFQDAGRTVAQVSGANAVAVGQNLYVLGGLDGNSTVDLCRTGTLDATTYSIGGFGNNGPKLVTARARMGLVVLGNYIYAIGGQSDRNGAALASVERCAIDPSIDEASGDFQSYGTGLRVARAAPALVVSGSNLYVIGGTQTSSYNGINSVEVAPIAADGSLGTFSVVSGLTLGTARGFEAAAVVGNFLQLFGGLDSSGPLGSVEQAGLL